MTVVFMCGAKGDGVGMARSIQSSPHCSMHVLESFYAYSICS